MYEFPQFKVIGCTIQINTKNKIRVVEKFHSGDSQNYFTQPFHETKTR